MEFGTAPNSKLRSGSSCGSQISNGTVWVPWHNSYAGQERDDRAGFNVAFQNAPRVAESIDPVKDSDVFRLTGRKRNNGPIAGTRRFRLSQWRARGPTAEESEAREAPFRAACVEAATRMARAGSPITKRNRLTPEAHHIIRKMLGDPRAHIKDPEVKAALLAAAAVDQSLVYIELDPHHAAGYYPANERELANRNWGRKE